MEPALLLGKGTEEGVVEAVEVSFCSVAAFPLILAIVPQSKTRLTFTRKENGGLFIRGSMEDGEYKAGLMRLSQGASNLIGPDATRLRLRHQPRDATGASIAPARTRLRRPAGELLDGCTELLAELSEHTDPANPPIRTLIGARYDRLVQLNTPLLTTC